MKNKILNYINDNYDNLLAISKKITKGHPDYCELLQEVCLQIAERNEIDLDSERNILYYITGLLRINYNSVTSRFHYNIRKDRNLFEELPYDLGKDYNIDDTYDYTREELIVAMEQSIAELDWFHRELWETYQVLGSYKKVNLSTRIPTGSVGMYINEAKEVLRNNIRNKLEIN